MPITFNVGQYTLHEGDTLYIRGYRSGDNADEPSARLRVLGNPYQKSFAVVEGALINSIDGSYSIGFNDKTDSFVVGFKVLNNLSEDTKLGVSVGPDRTNNLTAYDTVTFSAIDGPRPGGALGEKALVSPLSDDPLSPGVWRFFNTQSGSHFYSQGDEADFVNDNITGYSLEGVAFGSLPPNQGMPTWRFINRETGEHFWTANQSEYANLAFNKRQKLEWKFDSLSFNVYSPEQPQPAGTTAIYRALNTSSGDHFWTANSLELNGLLARNPAWVTEGIAWYSPT